MSEDADTVIDRIIAVWPGFTLKERARWAQTIADHHYGGDYQHAYSVLSGEEPRHA